MTNIALGILLALHEHKEIHGTEELARILNSRDHYVFTNAIMLANYGMIGMEISPGGRGNKTVYRDRGVIKVEHHDNNQ